MCIQMIEVEVCGEIKPLGIVTPTYMLKCTVIRLV